MAPSPLLVHSALLLVSLLFGANYVFTKQLLDAHLTAPAWVFYRIAAATVVLVPMALLWARHRPPLRLLPVLALASLLGVVGNQVLFTEGMARTTPAHSAVINACIPTWTLCIAALCRQERFTPAKAFAVLIALAGVATLLRADELLAGGQGITREQLIGDLLTWSNGLMFAMHLVLMRKVAKGLDPFATVAVLFVSATLMVPLYSGPSLTAESWRTVTTPPALWFALYAVLFATVFTYALNTWALRHTRSSQVALYINVQPLVAAALGPAFGMPVPDWRFFVALACVSTGLVLQTRSA